VLVNYVLCHCFPYSIICLAQESPYLIAFWIVMSKVRLEAFMWGAGTAIAELPPYFMARAGEYTLRPVWNLCSSVQLDESI